MTKAWHSHHKPAHAAVCALKWVDGDTSTACVVASAPTAPALQDGNTWEISRLCVGPDAARFARSYLAAGWVPVAMVDGREHTTGNRAQRTLPGLYEPSTQTIDRVRWERGPREGLYGCLWTGERWIGLFS